VRPYADGPIPLHPNTPKPDHTQVFKERMMGRARTLTIREPEASKQLPEFLRPAMVPPHVWERLTYRTMGENIQAVVGEEVYGTITREEALDEKRNLGHLLATRIQRHYLMRVKPELLIC
jgi:hypothetical protein